MTDPSAPLILCLECSTQQAGVALFRGSYNLALQTWARETNQGEQLTPAVESLFQKTNLKISDLDAIATGIGPGSFTGVRIAVNTAKSIAFALQKPVLAFNTLHLLAQGKYLENSVQTKSKIVAALDALNGNFFLATYTTTNDQLKEQISPSLATRDEVLAQVNVEGESAVLVGALDSLTSAVFPKVESLASLALSGYLNRSTLNWNQLAPLYIRASSAEEKLGKLNERAKNISGK